MPRMIDWRCSCGHVIVDDYVAIDATKACPTCSAAMEQDWLPRTTRNAQWDDASAVMIHVNAKTGEVSYPADHSAKLRDGYERIYLRSLSEVNKFEREHKVANHVMHYDSNGRGLDDTYRGQRDGWNH